RKPGAQKGTDDVRRPFLREQTCVRAGAEIPRWALVIFVPIKTPHPALHDHAAHPVVPVITDEVETQIGAGVGTLKTDVVVKYYFRQPNNFLVRLNCNLAGSRRVIAQWPQ